MKVSLIAPSNVEKLSSIIGKPIGEIETISKEVGRILARSCCQLVVIFDHNGVRALVADSFKENGGELEMLYTKNDYDWHVNASMMGHLEEADIRTEKASWHDMLLSLVKDSDLVVCAGLSAGVFAEIGYMKWDYEQNTGKVKALIGIEELLPDGKFPKEISYDAVGKLLEVSSVKGLPKAIGKFCL
jgi:hypothetical protein